MLDNLVKIYDDFAKSSRMQDLQQLAKELNHPFTKRVSFGPQTSEIKGFDLFSKKGSKRFIGIIDFPVQAFKGRIRFYDYLRTRELETSTHSVVEVYCNDLFTEEFKIQPRGAFRKMKGLFVRGSAPFKTLKEFNSKFEVTEYDEGSLLRASALDLMVDYEGVSIEADGNYLIFYYRKKEVPIGDVIKMVEFAEEFTRLTKFDFSDDFV